MRGVVFLGDCKLDLATVPDPTPGPGEVIVEIKASGMCGSDLHVYRQSSEFANSKVIRGHEPCGVVVAVGKGVFNPYARIGSRVMVHHYQGCTDCPHCRMGWPQMCQEELTVYSDTAHGAHAPFMKAAANTLVPLDDRLSFSAGAAVACGTGTAWGAFERMGLSGRDILVIFGQGPVGLSATLLAKAQGARVIAVDVDDTRLAKATAFGADHIVNSSNEDAVERVKQLTSGLGATMALETAGAVAAGHDAVLSVRPWGTVCLVGIGAELKISLGKLLRRQLRILTSWTMSIQAQLACAEFVIERGIDLDALFSHRWSIDQAEEAYQVFNLQNAGKGVFLF